MERQKVLYDENKRIQIILLEGALRCRLCTPATLLGQLDRLLIALDIPALALGIIPFTAQLPVLPLCGFDIYDKDVVNIETLTREEKIRDPGEVEKYVQIFNVLTEVAGFDDEARAIIQPIMRELAIELRGT